MINDMKRLLLAADLDGTLFYPKRFRSMISKRNLKFLRAFIDAGNRFVAITGRSDRYMQKMKKVIQRPFDFIGCNSAVIVADNKYVSESFLPKVINQVIDDLNDLFDVRGLLLLGENSPIIVTGPERGWLAIKGMEIFYKSQGAYSEDFVVDHHHFYRMINEGKAYKLMVFFGYSKKKKEYASKVNSYLREHYPDIESAWSGSVVEITAKNISKGNGLHAYSQYLNIAPDDIIVVGDSGNDISMFKAFPNHSFVMKHASQKIKKYAKQQIKYVYQLAGYIQQLQGVKDEFDQ
ncbi:MAG TPA: HAD-IIB family hydrolase [Bacilli bacterium]|jgi:Cof subfamily protein (haloacid dehalogenase superfamily)|nr:HAD-IIB family hydrolase [Bacilli bacterium]HKM11159.1 HAD-IIB family hydrolase [Bacilli bacterium]